MKIMNFTEANQELAKFYGPQPTKYSLDTMRALMAYLGDPQETLRIIHIAGTSGKTSTAYYAAALLTAAGYKTGLTVSPHVDEINERVQINITPLPEAEFCAALSEFLELISQSKIVPSWFELMVAFAYWYFAKTKVDFAVIEVGLGGLLDGTNVINRADKTCVITDVGFDHTKILGTTLGDIARQKAGVIQPGNRVYMYQQGHDVMKAVREAIESKNALLHLVRAHTENSDLPGFQQRNFELAHVAVAGVLEAFSLPSLTTENLKQAQSTYIPGRMETINYHGKTIILDGAHNPQKLQALKEALKARYGDQPVAALIGFVEGDDTRIEGALDVIKTITQNCIATSFVTAKDYIKHSMNPDDIAIKSDFLIVVDSNVESAFERLLEQPEDILLVTGSFYLLNHIRPLMLRA